MKAVDEAGESVALEVALATAEQGISPRPASGQSGHVRQTIGRCLLLAAALYYLVAAYRIAITKEPFIDEGWFASPAYNLAFHGFMGTTVLEPRGSWLGGELTGIHQYTYWVMPLYLVAQAGWYRLFGFGLVQMRLLSTFWGAIALAALYFIVERLTQNFIAASLTVLLTAVDFTFLWSAADGRMDMMSLGLGLAGLAAYLVLRDWSLSRSLLVANSLLAASIFTHPNGVIWILCLAILVFTFDLKRLRVADVGSVLPYAAFAAGWGMYIAKRPDYFLAQFRANANPPTGTRGAGLRHPDMAALRELFRYSSHFLHSTWSWPEWSPSVGIPLLYLAICIAAYAHYRKTGDRGLGMVLQFLVLTVFMMTFFDTLKAENYLALVMPLYAAVAAVWVCTQEGQRSRLLWGCGALAAIVALQAATVIEKLRIDPLRDDYRPVVAFLKTRPSAQVDGDAVLGFELGYDRLVDDARMGFDSKRKFELVVTDRWYRWSRDSIFWHYDLKAYYYTRFLLEHDYHPVFIRGNYAVYQLNSWTPPEPARGVATDSGTSQRPRR